jgi:excinuclease ABC subunit C
MDIDKVKKFNLPTTPGCYQFFNKQGEIIYIGKAINLKSRVLSYWQKGSQLTPAKQKMITEIEQLKWIEVDSEIEALLLEANLIKKHQPYYNIDLRDDKRFVYIKVSPDDEIPTIAMTRKLDKSGKYFGPFVSAQSVKETLKAIRKIWPYCTEKKISAKPCFYYQIGRCAGICGGIISRPDYLKQIIKPIILFLEGKKNTLIKDYELRIKNLEKKSKAGKIAEEENKELIKLKYILLNIKQVLANAQVLSVGEKYSNDVVELAKVLNLAKIPERIEGYDISNIFGQEAVGSMVVFAGGEAEKSEYKKFKIKLQTNSNKRGDTQMLEEVFTRRFNNDWPLPDLIIIDGGKAQLGVALRVLKKNKLDIMAIGITKGEGLRSSIAPDKIFFPREAKSLELPLNSPALHLIKRVRDEAHRFAIGYHRQLRSKKFIQK